MTDEEIVKQKWPDALALADEGLWSIRTPTAFGNRMVELMPLDDDDPEFPTEAEAWADAAKRIQEPGA